MNDVAKLMDAICVAWTKCLPKPYGDGEFSSAVDGMTDCNRFVNMVCQQMGYFKFVPEGKREPILANEMFDYMQRQINQWKDISGQQAQWYANQGKVVVAAQKNPTGHGHVCLVRTGNVGISGNWQSDQVPKVANVSRPDLCHIDRGANYAFETPPKYFVLLEPV